MWLTAPLLSVPHLFIVRPLWLTTPLAIVRPTVFTVRPYVVVYSPTTCLSVIRCPSASDYPGRAAADR